MCSGSSMMPTTGINWWWLSARFLNSMLRTDTIAPPRVPEFALFDAAKLVEELAIYPSMSDSGEYRIQSETSFEQPLSDVLFFKISALFYYNSTVPEGVDKQDTKILASLVYKF